MRYGISTLIWGVLALCLFTGHANASMILPFSDLSSDKTAADDLSATVMFTVSGNQLFIDITNDSDYQIAQLYFNAAPTLTGLSFAPLLDWSIFGAATDPEQVKSPFGEYDWLIDFGSGPANRLGSGLTQLTLVMTGTTSETMIGNTFSSNPPGGNSALAVLKFEAGPGDDSAFGATLVPEPVTGMLMLGGCAVYGLCRRRKR